MADEPLYDNLPVAVELYNQPRVSAAEIFEALTLHEGNIAACCRELSMTRSKLMERINQTPELMELLSDLREEVLDYAEGFQFKRAKSGADPASERFLLSTIGKQRGYSTSVAGMGANGDIVVTIKRFGEDQKDGQLEG